MKYFVATQRNNTKISLLLEEGSEEYEFYRTHPSVKNVYVFRQATKEEIKDMAGKTEDVSEPVEIKPKRGKDKEVEE